MPLKSVYWKRFCVIVWYRPTRKTVCETKFRVCAWCTSCFGLRGIVLRDHIRQVNVRQIESWIQDSNTVDRKDRHTFRNACFQSNRIHFVHSHEEPTAFTFSSCVSSSSYSEGKRYEDWLANHISNYQQLAFSATATRVGTRTVWIYLNWNFLTTGKVWLVIL